MTSCTKRYVDIPFAHRQHNHDGHCALIHGHNWSFEFEFVADSLDENGFVIDFGKLKWLKDWLNQKFDHALVLNESDPYLDEIRDFCSGIAGDKTCNQPDVPIFAKILVVPNCGAEGLAAWLLEQINNAFDGAGATLKECPNPSWPDTVERGVRVHRVTVFEDSKNSATVGIS